MRSSLSLLVLFLWIARPVSADLPAPAAAIIGQSLPNTGAAVVEALHATARSAGFNPAYLAPDALADSTALQRFQVLLIANARSLPLACIPAVRQYMDQGGHVVALGLPAWQDLVTRADGRWLTRDQRDAALQAIKPQHTLVDFESGDLAAWHRSSHKPELPSTRSIDPAGAGKALHISIPGLNGWETLIRDFDRPFAPGQSITCFRAKGSANTRALLLEWGERDGSRWLATVRLTDEWQEYRLLPDAFSPWQPPAGRGHRGDRFNPANAVRFAVGLAVSHMAIPAGRQEYWFDDLATAANPLGDGPQPADIPAIEGLCPAYKFYPITTPVQVIAARYPQFVRADSGLLAMHPRPQGAGYLKDRPWRWQPLLTAIDPRDGDFRGAVAALVMPIHRPMPSGVIAGFTPADPAFYSDPTVRKVLSDAIASIRRGVFIQEGGAQYYTAFEKQSIRLGARVAALKSASAGEYTVRLQVTADGAQNPAYQRDWLVRLAPGEATEVNDAWTPESWPAGGYRVAALLLENARVVDALRHELHVWRPREKPAFIEARDGGLWLDGKPWKAHGVNYMPSSGVGLDHGGLFEQWLGAAAYDPQVIERDLRRIRGMGMNSISIFLYHQSMAAQNALDMLRRCEQLSLKVNLSLRPGTPMDFHWDQMRQIIQTLQLARNDTIFTYDLAWEPSHFDEKHQQRYNPHWREWVIRKYGSVEKAERAWQVPGPRAGGELVVPSMRMLTADGAWRGMVADYRLFLDELLASRYAEARRLVKSIDPNHAVSFRKQFSGDPTFNNANLLPYDFYGLRDAVDIWEPEAYGRIGDWSQVKPGHFTAAYARLCDPAKPVVWAEIGVSAWDTATMFPDPAKLAFQAQYYRDFHRMLRMSGADGVYYWWYPGGYRANEQSDYGIINPDGTDRPVTRVIREESDRFLAAPRPPAPAVVIRVNRDADARGLFGIYEKVKDQYWKAIDAGQQVQLQWHSKPGEQ